MSPVLYIYNMAVRSLKLLGGAVRGSEGHSAAADDLASEKWHLLAKRALFSTITGAGQLPPCPPPVFIITEDNVNGDRYNKACPCTMLIRYLNMLNVCNFDQSYHLPVNIT